MEPEIVLDGAVINEDSPCYLIAEIGHNHQGKVDLAKDLIRSAKANGANAVKFQKRDNRTLLTKECYNKPYINDNSYGNTYGEHREALEFARHEYKELIEVANEESITLFATAFDMASADMLNELGIPFFKTASGDLTNIPLLTHIASFGKPIIVSTGGGTIEDVSRAYDAIMPINKDFCLLQCTAAYPVYNYEEFNLKVLCTYRKEFPDVVVGLSDHESGITAAVVAFALGARVIEKHYTLNRAWKGTDHAFSLSPIGLRKLNKYLANMHCALGDGVKRRYPSEKEPITKMSKKIVASRKLAMGSSLRMEDLAFKSPGNGLLPYEAEKLVGRKLLRTIDEDTALSFDDVA